MGINRKELEEKTFQWFNSSISDKDYNSLSMSYLAHRNYRLYKYQSPLASLDTLSRFFEHLKTNCLHHLCLMILSTVNFPIRLHLAKRLSVKSTLSSILCSELAVLQSSLTIY